MTSNEEKAKLLNDLLVINPQVGSVGNTPDVPDLTLNVPDTGYPPEPFLSEPTEYPPDIVGYPTYDQTNHMATANKLESQPSMHNEEGWSGVVNPPTSTQGLNLNLDDRIYETKFSDSIDDTREEYIHPDGEEPAAAVRIVDDIHTASEIHIHLNIEGDEEEDDDNDGEEEQIKLDLPPRKNKIQESIGQVRDEFEWLSDEYLDKVSTLNTDGQWYLIRASAETITDHRGEGETHRRKLDGDELHSMARTAINKTMDINHLGERYKTQALIADSEYDKKRKEIQMLVHESDPEIITAIKNHDITAVSINGGAPRSQSIECDQTECFNVPRGVVLAELDGIALTWVVTARDGMEWQGEHIDPAKPGVASTKIQILD